jgi:hypothetical protein
MSARTSVFLVFAVFSLVVFPVAIASHSHLYADGTYFFAKILELRTFDVSGHTPSRVAPQFLTQIGVAVAIYCGESNIRHLSWLYGLALFYFPWFAYMLACWLFLRANMPDPAVLVALLYCLLTCSTGFFVISESHLATSLFILTLAVITTGNLRSLLVQASLLVLWLLSVSSYEFWALFFPICLGLLLTQSQTTPVSRARVDTRIAFAMLYGLGTVLNVYFIIFTDFPVNRDAMWGSHFSTVWWEFVAVFLLFLLSILYVLSSMLVSSQGPRVPWWIRRCIAATERAASSSSFFVLLGLATVGGVAATMLYKVGTPWNSYALRTLNLVLPLLFAFFLITFQKLSSHGVLLPGTTSHAVISHKILIFGLVAMLFITSQGRLFHALGFWDFKKRVFAATQSHTGYVVVGDALPGLERYGWFWTYPAMSLILQAMQTTSVKSVLYDPNVSWQPFGPLDANRARAFLSSISVPN